MRAWDRTAMCSAAPYIVPAGKGQGAHGLLIADDDAHRMARGQQKHRRGDQSGRRDKVTAPLQAPLP
jgi:hypothetical protein